MAEPTVTELLRELGESSRELIKKEIHLARVEVLESVQGMKRGTIWLGVALVPAVMALIALTFALVLGLMNVLVPWAAALVAAGILLVVGGVLALVGARKLRSTHPLPERALESVREDVQWVRHHLS